MVEDMRRHAGRVPSLASAQLDMNLITGSPHWRPIFTLQSVAGPPHGLSAAASRHMPHAVRLSGPASTQTASRSVVCRSPLGRNSLSNAVVFVLYAGRQSRNHAM
jgi:hypothetical protein